MAPIALTVRSTILHTAPSRSKRAPSAAHNLSVLIGITVSIICVVVTVGTICWLLRRRKRKAAKSPEKPSEIDTTYAGTEIKYRRISELPVPEVVPPEYFKSPQPTSNRATTLESKTAARSDSSKEKECGTPNQVFSYNQRTLLELPSNEEVHFSHLPFASANIGNSNDRQQNTISDYVNPFAVEHRPNPVYYSSFAGPSHTPDVFPHQEASFADIEMPQIDERITFDIDLATSDTEMLPAGTSSDSCELRLPEPIHGSIDNQMSTDIDQEEVSWPLANNHHLAQDLPHPEGRAQTRNLKNPPKHNKVASMHLFQRLLLIWLLARG
ncbi:hypothetical protein GT037_008433 [Alternaria burnsii]|uniref:Uncharacterized protein n=1 Tax=Alternaria burnsii TaxID=1187904 RepID=A0A8H7B1X4_9PLEO|nr:uncharacterized protein GT037_008433 [Alternaria burnsii]KAF7673818.1 hypothetical protein GT037_008433 [Alternaria burnsii]